MGKSAMGGPRRKDGKPRRPQLVGQDGRKYRDTPGNRRKLGMPPHPDDLGPTLTDPIKTHVETNTEKDAEAKKILAAKLQGSTTGGKDAAPPPQSAPAPVPSIDFNVVLSIINTVLKQANEHLAMTDLEQASIGTSLDAVAKKYFPNADVGPEIMLALSLGGYLVRVLYLDKPTPKKKSANVIDIKPESDFKHDVEKN